MSSRGFELAWKSVVFRIFPAVFARSLLTQQRRETFRRLVHKMTNDFECYFDRWGLKIILWTVSRCSSCFMWNVEIGRSSGRHAARFFVKQSSVAKWPPSGRTLGGWVTRRWRLHVLYVGRYQAFPGVAGVSAAANMGDRYWFLVIVFMDLLHVNNNNNNNNNNTNNN